MSIAVTDFFLPDEFLYRLYHSNTFVLHLVSIVKIYLLTCSKTKVSRLTFLFCCFISVLLKSIAALKFHTFCNSFMNTGFKSWGLGRAAVCDCGTPWSFL